MNTTLFDKIYVERATLFLEDYCKKLELNFDKFNDFLYDNGAILGGSLALSCFDPSFVPNDMDIFVFQNEKKVMNRMYKRGLLDCFENIENISSVSIPLHNIFTINKQIPSEYIYTFSKNGINVIDLVIFNITLEKFIETQNFICNRFYWNGCKWNIPVTNVEKFIKDKTMDLENLCGMDVLIIYEPWSQFSSMNDIDEIFIKQIDVYMKDLSTEVVKELNTYFESKKLACFDKFLLVKTYYRCYKYINRGYHIPNFESFIKDSYDKFPTYDDYAKQITETGKITLFSGYELKI